MKKLIFLSLISLCAFTVSAQQTYFPTSIPPSSISFTPTYRFIGTDSLAKFYLSNSGRFSQFYTAAQVNALFLRSIFAGNGLSGNGSSGSPIILGGTLTAPTIINYSLPDSLKFFDPSTSSGLFFKGGASGGINIIENNGSFHTTLGASAGSYSFQVANGSSNSGLTGSASNGLGIIDQIKNLGIAFAGNYTTNQRLQRLSVPSVGTTIALIDSAIAAHPGTDSTLYKKDDSIHNTNRAVDLKLHTLTFHGQSAVDTLALSIDHTNGFLMDSYNKAHHLEGFITFANNINNLESVDSLGNSADVYTNSSGITHAHTILQAYQASTAHSEQIILSTPFNGGSRGISVYNTIDSAGMRYTSYLDYYHADSLTLMPKQWIEANFAPIAGGGYVPTSRTLTINGTALDLSTNRSWSVGTLTSITPGYGFTSSTPITGSGTMTIDTTKLQTVLNFFPKADTRYVKTSALLNHVAGYGLSGSNYNTSVSQTWLVDTTAISTKYYAGIVVGADGVVSGLVTTTVTTTATTTAGTYRRNNVLITIGSSTNTTIDAQNATLNRYDLIVGDASGVLSMVQGALNADAVEPAIPANKTLIASIYIPATGGTVTTTGGGSGKGTVTKVTSATTDILVANQTTTPVLTLNKVNGVPITYYDPTSPIQAQLNGKQATLVSGTNIKTINSVSLLGSGNIVISGSTQVYSEIPTGTINGSNTSFTIAHTPLAGISLFLNGLMAIPTTDYSVSGTTITMVTAPVSGDNLMINYSY